MSEITCNKCGGYDNINGGPDGHTTEQCNTKYCDDCEEYCGHNTANCPYDYEPEQSHTHQDNDDGYVGKDTEDFVENIEEH